MKEQPVTPKEIVTMYDISVKGCLNCELVVERRIEGSQEKRGQKPLSPLRLDTRAVLLFLNEQKLVTVYCKYA